MSRTINGVPRISSDPASTSYVDGSVAIEQSERELADLNAVQKSGDTMSGALDMGSQSIVNLAAPSSAQDATTKSYVDDLVQGLSWKQAAHVASTGDVDIASAPGSIDGHALNPQERILLKDQALPEENGLYEFNGEGNALTRTSDMSTWTEVVGAVVYVQQGLTNSGSKFNTTSVPGGTIDITPIVFTTFSSSGTVDGSGTADEVAYWTGAGTLASEAHLSPMRGGLGIDASASTGVLKFSGGTASASSILNADIDASAGIALSKLETVTVDRALASDASGYVSASSVTSAELGRLSGVSDNVQTQLNDLSSAISNVDVRTITNSNPGVNGSFAAWDDAGMLSSVPGYTFTDTGTLKVGAQNSLVIPALTTDYISISISPTVSNTGLTNLTGVQLNSPIDETVTNYHGFQVYGYGTNAPANQVSYLSQPGYSATGGNLVHFQATGSVGLSGSKTAFKFDAIGDASSIVSFSATPTGDASSGQGFEYVPAGSYTDISGLKINFSSVTATNRPIGIELDGGTLVAGTTFSTVSDLPFLVDTGNLIRPIFQVKALEPITNTDVILTNLAGFMEFHDDYSSGPLGIGTTAVGFASQVAVDAGKIVSNISMLTAGLAVDSTSAGGTVTDAHLIRAIAWNFGGFLNIGTIYGLQIESGLSGLATTAFGISVEDTGAENYLAKSLMVSGLTKTVSDNSIAIEIGDKKQLRIGRFSTVERTALPNISGTLVYDNDSARIFQNDGSGWNSIGGDFMADGSVPMTGDLDMGGNNIVNIFSAQVVDEGAPNVTTDILPALINLQNLDSAKLGTISSDGASFSDLGTTAASSLSVSELYSGPTNPGFGIRADNQPLSLAATQFSIKDADAPGSTVEYALIYRDPVSSDFRLTSLNGIKLEAAVGTQIQSFSPISLMSANRVVDLLDPIGNQDAATKKYVDDAIAAIPGGGGGGDFMADGSVPMTGSLNLGNNLIVSVSDPSNPQDAATKNYVDNATSGGPFLPLDGHLAMTNTLNTQVLNVNGHNIEGVGNILDSGSGIGILTTGGNVQLDTGGTGQININSGQISLNAVSGGISIQGETALNSYKITSLGTPTLATDAATKGYVDDLVQGLSWKQAAHVASTTDVDITSAPASIDGHSLNPGERVLLKDQSLPAQNGLYNFNGTGNALTRTSDMNAWAEVVGAVVYVQQGLTNGGAKFNTTNVPGGTIDVTPITFTTFSGSGSISGTGLAGQVAYWTGAATLSSEAQLSPSRGGLGIDASSSTGVAKFGAGSASVSSIVNADISSSAAISLSKLTSVTANRALTSDASGYVSASSATSTELGYLSGVTSAIQTQLGGKQDTITGAATTVTSSDLTASRALASDVSGKIAVSAVTSAELGYLSGVTSSIQTQLNNKSSGPVDTAISALDIDWSLGDSFYKLISTSSVFTFSNTVNGKTISVFIKNTGASDLSVTFPTALASGVLNVVVSPGKENVYTFIKSNSKFYVSVVADMA